MINQGIDFLRARDGRRRGTNGNGDRTASHRPVVVPLTGEESNIRDLASEDDDEPAGLEGLAEEAERTHAQELVARVMTALDPKDAELVKLRHLTAGTASREQVAAMAGLTVGEFRWRYTRAWDRFVEAVALDAPTPRCHRVRHLLGELDAGLASAETAAEIDAHTLDCASCRVFARESYRALELMPLVPAVGFAERCANRLGVLWDRSGPESTAGAGPAAAGAGIWALLGGGGTGVLKVVAIVCSTTAVTAGLCAGVAIVIDDLRDSKSPATRRAERAPALRATPTPRPVASAAPTVAATPTPSPRRRPTRRPPRRRTTADTSGESQIPASAPRGASEFNPSASSASVDPAPATDAGGGEFTP